MNTLYLDLETFSTIPLSCGVHKYSEAVEILLFAYAFNDGPVNVWDVTADKDMPEDLKGYLKRADYLCAHKSGFDRVVLERLMPEIFKGRLWRDTMVRALTHGLPGGLDLLCQIYKLPEDQAKVKEGRTLIHLFCKMQKKMKKGKEYTIRYDRNSHPAEWAKFIKYAGNDIIAMRVLDKKIPSWNTVEPEISYWHLDQKINDRGFAVDADLARAAIKAVAKEKVIRDAQTKEATGGEVNSATQRDAMLKHILEEYGVTLPDMQMSTLIRRLEDPDLPEPVKELINLRLESSGTSTKKYTTLIESCNSDGRLRGTLQFSGAPRSSRWSGRIFQPQNLPRPKFKHDEVELAIEALKSDAAEFIYDNVTEMASSAIRGAIVASPGKKLVVSDLSAIEGRMLAWLAKEEWKIDYYRDFDLGLIEYDVYKMTYAKTFNVDPKDVGKKERQYGKVIELFGGYGGGVGAFITFAKSFNINLNELAESVWSSLPKYITKEAKNFYDYCVEEKKTFGLDEKTFVACDSIKRLWREANPNVVDYWNQIEQGVRLVLNSKDNAESLVHGYKIDRKGSWLRVRLPSGRYLCYAGACIQDNKIKYLGINQYTRKWCKLSTYAGKLVENYTQASSRDVLAHGMQLAENAGYEVVLSVHDELITEAPDTKEYSHEGLSKLMSTNPPWAKGLPLAAAGFESYRYRKD